MSPSPQSALAPLSGKETAQSVRWKGTVAYDGTRLSGWQSQPGGNTVQDFIEARLAQIFGRRVRIHGSGRTDAGVHAKAHPFHFDAYWPHGEQALLRALRVGLPAALAITAVTQVKDTFHARFSAKGKRYSYHWFEGHPLPWQSPYCNSLGNRRLDIAAMNAAAAPLLGEHDFSAFGANRGDDSVENPVKTLYRLDVRRSGARLTLVTEGSGYLYKMVRTLAGALAEVGVGKLAPESLAQILKSGERPMSLPVAPARGLWLEKVYYTRVPSAAKRPPASTSVATKNALQPPLAVLSPPHVAAPRSSSSAQGERSKAQGAALQGRTAQAGSKEKTSG